MDVGHRGDRGGRAAHPGHPLFAALYDGLTGAFERHLLGPLREELLAGCSGDVLLIGVGTGADLAVLSRNRTGPERPRLWAVDPDPHMLRRASLRARSLGLPVEFVEAAAERLPFPAHSFDHVVTSLVLCSVRDVPRSLAEARRVLRPAGSLHFLEHVRAEGQAGRWQDGLRPLWAAVAGGCQLNRATGEELRQAFGEVRWREVPLPFPLCRLLLGQAR